MIQASMVTEVNQKLVRSVADYIHVHISQPIALKLNAIAAQLHFSANHLNYIQAANGASDQRIYNSA